MVDIDCTIGCEQSRWFAMATYGSLRSGGALFAIRGEFNSGKFSVSSRRLVSFLVGLPR
jgi:hypothetical protein